VSRCRQLAHMAALALILAAASAPAAVACNYPTLGGLVVSSVHPGDTVSFTIVNLSPGAQWRVELDGQTVASGVASDNTVWGTYRVPDLGDSARPVNVASIATHDDIPDGEYQSPPQALQYSTPSAAPAPPAASSTAPPSAQPAPGQPTAHAQPAPGKPAAGAKPTTKPSSDAPTPAREPSAQRAGHRGHRDTATRPRRTQRPAQAVVPAVTVAPRAAPAAAPAHVAATPRARHKRTSAATGSGGALVGSAARLRRLASDVWPTPEPPSADAIGFPAASDRMPAIPIAAGLLAAALLALATLVAFLRRRRDGTVSRRHAPDDTPSSPARRTLPLTDEESRMLAIEAELQEIVAEACADDEHVRDASRTVARSP